MGTSHENRRLICEEDRGSEGTREESQRESKRRLVWSGYFGNIAVVLAVGLAVALIGCGNGSTPETAAEITGETTAEGTAVLESNELLPAVQATRRGQEFVRIGGTPLIEFTTLRERPLEGGGIDVEILFDRDNLPPQVGGRDQQPFARHVRILGEFILRQVWRDKHFTLHAYDNKAAWDARVLCEQAHEGQPADKFDEIEGGPACTNATELGKVHLVLEVFRDLTTGQSKNTWVGPDE